MLELRQWNSKESNDGAIYKIMETASLSFTGSRSSQEFIEIESRISIMSTQPRQFLYLVDGELVVASLGVIVRGGLAPSSLNLLVILVNTHPQYRKRGIMNELIIQLMKYYEGGDLTHDDWEVDDDTFERASSFKHKYLNPFPKENNFWTLYSAVGNYYQRFGFVPNVEFIQLVKKVDIGIIEGLEMFNVLENERVLLCDQDSNLLTDARYLPTRQFTPSDMNAAFTELPFFDYVSRAKLYCEVNKIPFEGEIGYEIKHEDECTRVFVTPDIRFNGLCVHRVYSNVNSKEILIKHLERIFLYVQSKFGKWFASLPAIKVNVPSITIKVSPGDFMLFGDCQLDDIEHQLERLGFSVIQKGGLVPMSKDFGHSGISDSAKWPFNGYWAFN